MGKILVIEAFYGGSHKQLIDTVMQSKIKPCFHTRSLLNFSHPI